MNRIRTCRTRAVGIRNAVIGIAGLRSTIADGSAQCALCDPQYHVDGINDSIRRAAEHLPRIDAIGVSSAGIYVNNRTMVASLFRKVEGAEFTARIKSIYLDVAKIWEDRVAIFGGSYGASAAQAARRYAGG